MAVRGMFSRFGFLAGFSPRMLLVMSGNFGHRRIPQKGVQGFLLLREILPLAGQKLIKVNLVAVELRSVHTDKLGLAANAAPAGATHAGSVDHDRVKTHEGLNTVRLGGLGAELHHHPWADGVDKVDVSGLAQLLEWLGHQTVAAAASIIGSDYELVTDLTHPVLPEQQALVAGSNDGDDLVAGLLQGPCDGVDRCHPDTSAGHDARAQLLDLTEQQALVAGSNDGDALVAGLLQGPCDGVDRCHPDTSAGHDDRAQLLDLTGYAQR